MDSSDNVFGDIRILFLVVLIDIGGIIGGREGVVLTVEGEGMSVVKSAFMWEILLWT